jgi:predicted DNA-binding protein
MCSLGGEIMKFNKGPEVSRRGRGRPPKETELTSKYPTLSIRLPPVLKAQLNAAAQIVQKPVWMVVADALEKYFLDMLSADREALEVLAKRLIDRERG